VSRSQSQLFNPKVNPRSPAEKRLRTPRDKLSLARYCQSARISIEISGVLARTQINASHLAILFSHDLPGFNYNVSSLTDDHDGTRGERYLYICTHTELPSACYLSLLRLLRIPPSEHGPLLIASFRTAWILSVLTQSVPFKSDQWQTNSGQTQRFIPGHRNPCLASCADKRMLGETSV